MGSSPSRANSSASPAVQPPVVQAPAAPYHQQGLRAMPASSLISSTGQATGASSYFRLANGATLALLLGDLTGYGGDAIVNAANNELAGGRGINGVIHRAAGPQLLQACYAIPEVSPGVRCPTGEARITPGFQLKARHVIHTVGPVYESHAVSSPLLGNAYRNSLRLANMQGLSSIAFPAISTGVYKYPLHEAAMVSLQAVADEVVQSRSHLKEVCFVLYDQQAFDQFAQAAQQLGLPPAQQHARQQAQEAAPGGTGFVVNPGTPHTKYLLPKAPGVELTLMLGDLVKCNVDAIVNAADPKLLGGGGIDAVIHRAAGPQLLQACYAIPEVSPGVRCPTGEARITPGFQLKARHVIHTVGPVYESHAVSSPLLGNAYRNSLRLANMQGLSSIAFPAISTGVYKYPLHEAAMVSMEAVQDAADRLKQVVFCLHDQTAYTTFTRAADSLGFCQASQPGNGGQRMYE